jgi:LmbE family N-acetylglucosaminyl deacetylase
LFVLGCVFGCAKRQSSIPCIDPKTAPTVVTPSEPACANDVLTSYESLLVFAPHPDDETLGFAGLIKAYMDQGKPVEVIVTTDGDAYCEACRFWKTSSVQGSTCSAAELSNFATAEMDSFGEVRHAESAEAAEILGRAAPTFLGYPDSGLGVAWKNFNENKPDEPLHRSDFSHCKDCISCERGYGGGPVTNFTANTLMQSLRQKISSTTSNTLLATTHWLDGHADHAALGKFVKSLNAELPQRRAIAFAVIHAHTPKTTPHPDCWYPVPQALVCPCDSEDCANQNPQWVASLNNYRFRPDWPAALPDDTDYGLAKQLCLPDTLYKGETATKLKAIRSYKSQLGFLARNESHPNALTGILDCNGYLISFVRRTEAFVLLAE